MNTILKITETENIKSYRQRIYETYVTHDVQLAHDLSRSGYEKIVEELEKNYLGFLPANRDAKVLEIASGPGYFAWFLGKYGYRNYTGIDLSAEQVKCANEKVPGYEFIAADAFEYLESGNGSYDLIMARHVLEHLFKDEVLRLLDLSCNALNPGGIFLAEVPNCGSPVFGSHNRYGEFTHENGFTSESLSHIFRVAGFYVKYCGAVRKAKLARDMPLKILDIVVRSLSNRGLSVYPEMFIAAEKPG